MENHGLLSDYPDRGGDSSPHRDRLHVINPPPQQEGGLKSCCESSGEDEGIDQPTRAGDRDNIGPARGGTHIFLKKYLLA